MGYAKSLAVEECERRHTSHPVSLMCFCHYVLYDVLLLTDRYHRSSIPTIISAWPGIEKTIDGLRKEPGGRGVRASTYGAAVLHDTGTITNDKASKDASLQVAGQVNKDATINRAKRREWWRERELTKGAGQPKRVARMKLGPDGGDYIQRGVSYMI